MPVAALLLLLSSALYSAPVSFKGYTFEAQVLKSNGMRYREFSLSGKVTLKVRPNEEYSIVVRNPLPVRAAVAVTIDGLNSIDGKRSSPRDAKKWIVGPNSSLTIAGWQTGKDTLRKFLFTGDEASYAQWKEGKEGKPYTKNLGVIGVAWFWNSRELDEALHPPQPFAEEAQSSGGIYKDRAAAGAPSAAKAERRAGTGMGHEQQNQVSEVEFDGNAGMFSVRDVLKIFYEFAKDPDEPLPFTNEEEEQGRFAPDMYK
jgi:hypothetical protein